MADSKISALSQATPASGDMIPGVKSGANKKFDVGEMPVSTSQQTAIDTSSTPRLTGGISYRQTGLSNWFTALLAATSAAPIDVVVVGDSINALGSIYVPPPPGGFEQLLNQQLGVSETINVPIGVYGQADYSPTATTTQGSVTSTALGGFGSSLSNGQVLTHVATCTGVKIAYRTDPSYGTLTVRDGAGGSVLGTINCAATAKSGNIATYTGLSNGSHTIHITSSGNTVVEIVKPTYGHKVHIWNCSHSGYKSADYTSNTYLALDLIDTLETAGTLKLVIIATGANDNGGSGYATDIPALISAVAAHTSADKALWFPYISGALPLSEYTAARTAAYGTGLPVIDSSTVAATSYGLDGTHPDAWQKRMLAIQQTAVLGGDPIGVLIRQIQDPDRPGGLRITSPTGTGTEFGYVSALLSIFADMPGPGWASGDGTTAFGDTTFARKSAAKWSLNNGKGTLEGNLGPAINAQTGTSYTLALSDAGKMITRSNAGASTQDLPSNATAAIPIGTMIHILNIGAGAVTVQAGSGATLTGANTVLQQDERAMVVKTSTNGWQITAPSPLTATSTTTLTNKRVTPRVGSTASSATPTINTDNVDAYSITALAADITSMTTNLSGTPTNAQKLIIRIKDDGTARAITWGSGFEAKGVALPTTTVISKVLTVGFIYDTVTSKWGCVASAQEA